MVAYRNTIQSNENPLVSFSLFLFNNNIQSNDANCYAQYIANIYDQLLKLAMKLIGPFPVTAAWIPNMRKATMASLECLISASLRFSIFSGSEAKPRGSK